MGRACFAYVAIAGTAEQGAVSAGDFSKEGTAINAAVKGEPVGSTNTKSITDGYIL